MRPLAGQYALTREQSKNSKHLHSKRKIRCSVKPGLWWKMSDLSRNSSDFVLHLESDDNLRKRGGISFADAEKFNNPASHKLSLFLDDDFQGFRDGRGILVHDSPYTSKSEYALLSSFVSSSSTGRHRKGIISYNADTVVITDNLEVWWVTSPRWRRFIPLFSVFCCFLGAVHLLAGTVLLILGDDYKSIPDPYLCVTPSCSRIAHWMMESMDETVSPCDDFYQFMCGNYIDARRNDRKAPPHLQMWVSSSGAFGDDILGMMNLEKVMSHEFMDKLHLAKVLKKPEENRVVKFYKSCLDIRSRRVAGMKPFTELIDVIKITSRNHDLNTIAAILSNYTGDWFFNEYWYAHGLSVVVEPMDIEQARLIGKDGETFETMKSLFRITSDTVAGVKSATGYNGSSDDVTDAAMAVQNLGLCLHEILEKCEKEAPDLDRVLPEDLGIFNFMEALRIAETIGFSEENSTFKLAHQEDACFLHSRTGQLHTLPSCLRKKGFDDAGIKFSYRLAWVLRVFLRFVNDLDDITFQKIFNPNDETKFDSKLFSKAIEFRKSWLDTQCFQSLASNYGFRSFEEFSNDFNTESILEYLQRYVRREERVLRKWIAQGKFKHLSQLDQELLKNKSSPVDQNIILEEKLYTSDALTSDLRTWQSDPKRYFWNVWNARHLSESEATYDWYFRDIFSPWDLKVGKDLLMAVQTVEASHGDTHDNKDTIFIPLTMLTVPFYQPEFRMLNYAGIGAIIGREVVRLSLTDDRFHRPHGDDDKYIDTGAGSENTGHQCECLIGTENCQFSYALREKNQTCYNYGRTNTFSSALAIKIAYEVYRKQEGYRTVRLKRHGSADTIVEPTYRPRVNDSEVDVIYYSYNVLKNRTIVRGPEVDISSLRYDLVPDLRISPKKLDHFEKYTQDQLFFMQLQRLHCYPPNPTYKESVNSVFQQVKEFAKAWKCPANSKMIAKRRLLE